MNQPVPSTCLLRYTAATFVIWHGTKPSALQNLVVCLRNRCRRMCSLCKQLSKYIVESESNFLHTFCNYRNAGMPPSLAPYSFRVSPQKTLEIQHTRSRFFVVRGERQRNPVLERLLCQPHTSLNQRSGYAHHKQPFRKGVCCSAASAEAKVVTSRPTIMPSMIRCIEPQVAAATDHADRTRFSSHLSRGKKILKPFHFRLLFTAIDSL